MHERWYRGWLAVGGECRVMVSTGAMPSVLAADTSEFPDRANDPKSFNWGVPSRSTYITEIDREADRLSALVRDLLDMSKIESGTAVNERVRGRQP